jgi:hypothetical protein
MGFGRYIKKVSKAIKRTVKKAGEAVEGLGKGIERIGKKYDDELYLIGGGLVGWGAHRLAESNPFDFNQDLPDIELPEYPEEPPAPPMSASEKPAEILIGRRKKKRAAAAAVKRTTASPVVTSNVGVNVPL